MSRQTDIDAASLWLFYRRNQGASRADAKRAFGWSEGTTTRRLADLGAPNDRLRAWLGALRVEKIPWETDGQFPKPWWYQQIQSLMMVGTPPWEPTDYVDITTDLRVVVPKGATIQEWAPVVHTLQMPSHKEVLSD